MWLVKEKCYERARASVSRKRKLSSLTNLCGVESKERWQQIIRQNLASGFIRLCVTISFEKKRNRFAMSKKGR